MKIIIGLGNPGKEYDKTRHNVGFMFIDYLKEKYGEKKSQEKLNSVLIETSINMEKVILAKPLTYMNLSGEAVVKIKNWYKVTNEDILIVYDDIDIEFGSVRYRLTGSAGTHNGMRNILNVLKEQNIPRIRIGIGKPKHSNHQLANYVLERFSKIEIEEINNIFEVAEQKVIEFLDKQ